MGSEIILEGGLVEAFVWLAFKDSLVSFSFDEKEEEKEFVGTLKHPRLRQRVLDSLLLYDRVLLCDNCGVHPNSSLLREGGVSIIDSPESASRPRRWGTPLFSDEQILLLQGIWPLVKPYIRRRVPVPYVVDRFDLLCEILADPAYPSRRAYEAEKGIIGFTSFLTLDLEEELIPLLDMLKIANVREIGFDSNKLSRYRGLFRKEIEAPIERPKSGYRVYAICLEEIPWLPTPRTMKEAFDLRSDRRLIDFRDRLWTWAKALQSDSLGAEIKIRRELRLAASSLGRVPTARRIGQFITYLSLPLSVVPFIGLPLAAIGVGAQAFGDLTEWRYRWLMFSS